MIELNKIYNEDCLEGMKRIAGQKHRFNYHRPSVREKKPTRERMVSEQQKTDDMRVDGIPKSRKKKYSMKCFAYQKT